MASTKPLSKRQQDILEFIRSELVNRGYSPTVREIVKQVGDKSPTSVHRHLKTLEARGYILRDGNKSRSIRLADGERGVPVVGTLRVGNQLGENDGASRIDLASISDPNRDLLLKVKGDGLLEQQIQDGDYLIIRKQEAYAESEMVVTADEFKRLSIRPFHSPSSQFQPLGLVIGVLRLVAPTAS